ncbi:MAG: NADP-dependent methylenetetrahydromethanopterin/methylenetetrahydrofolate dehydrogenase [Candidatus Altiarchaeota archaeon]
MEKILFALSTDPEPSVFDVVVAYDAGADVVFPINGVKVEDVKGIVYDCIFTRGVKDLENTAIFISGSNIEAAESVLKEVEKTFFGDFRVSVAADPQGAFTTSAAAVRKVIEGFDGSIKGKKVVVLAGTGPVGKCIAPLLSKEGANVSITSRNLEKAKSACEKMKESFGVNVVSHECRMVDEVGEVLSDADAVIGAGAPGVLLLKEETRSRLSKLKVLVDTNAVPPLGIEGVGVKDDLTDLGDGTMGVGAIGVGNLKMKIHRKIIKKLFSKNDYVFDLEKIYELSKEVSRS